MREILFRGKPKNKGDYHFFSQAWKDSCKDGFVYGSLVVNKNRDLGDRYYICVTALCSINSCVNNGMTSMIEVIPETIGEYTALNDKNGRMLFEGDVVKFYDITGVINYNRGCYCVKTNKLNWESRDNPAIDIVFIEYKNKIEIIGNIHDNPELIRGKNNDRQ